MTINFFPYSWHIDNKQTEITSIRTYGLNENNESVCLQIDDFKPYAYIELPKDISWTSTNVKYVQREIDKMLGNRCPLVWRFVHKKKLYGAYLNKHNNREEFPFLYCAFSNRKDAKILEYKLNKTDSRTGRQSPIYISGGIGNIVLKLHETDADPILQLTCCRKITTSSWLQCKGVEIKGEDCITSCHHEYNVEWEQIYPCDRNKTPKPKILGFDIEVNSSNPAKMPDASDPRDEIFQISCVISTEGVDDKKYIFSLGDPLQDKVGEDVIIVKCASESKLLSKYCDLIKDEKVNIISGYNILGFDIPYMINRAELNNLGKFAKQGFANVKAEQRTIKWSSSAYGTQEFEFLDAEGRLYVDLLPLVRRDYKFNNYKLKTISEYFIGATKDPLSVQGIFKCYRIGTAMDENGGYSMKARKAISICAKYCVQDSVLVVRLMEKLKTWVGLTEMASICNVPIFALYTQGQQIKVYSQIYRFCMEHNIVVEKEGYKTLATDRYIGAKVFPPKPGIYNYIVPFDFASLYPTTIIAYNIDYHTWVPDDSDIPDNKCHVMEWEDHLGCIHDPNVIRKLEIDKIVDQKKVEIDALRKQRDSIKDKVYKKQLQTQIAEETEKLKPYREERSEIQKALPKICMCAKRRYRFLKEPKGVLPTIIQDLLDSRKRVRKVNMKACYKKLEELEQEELETGIDNSEKIIAVKTEIDVLDKRQLAMKVSANSMYGAMGVRRGYLPFMIGAMATTYMGRVNIEHVAKIIPEKYGGELVYGDTDTLVATTPVLILENNQRCYKTLEELSDGNWSKTVTGKEMSKAKEGIKVWSDQGFTDIKYVMRHAIEKPLIKVLTHTGVVTCTLDHSLLWENGEPALGSEVNIGDKLMCKNLPLPEDTPLKPVYENNLTVEKLQDYKISNDVYEDLSAEMAFVWGVFYADGSCGTYKQEQYSKSTWAINKKDNLLLERCKNILVKHELSMDFKILDTMKSSHVNKLVVKGKSKTKKHIGSVTNFVTKYRKLFYNSRNYKKVPDIILNAPYSIREAFFMGYYSGDGSKKDPALTITNNGEIGCAGLYYLMRSLGYKVSINSRSDKQDTYKLTGSSPEQEFRYDANQVKKIESYKCDDEYIYDIETSNHHFAAGIGEMVVHNSNYIHFPHLKNAQETWDHALYVASEVTKMFPKPIVLEFEEEIYYWFFILSKKRYMYRKCLRDGVVDKKIGKKGVLLARRDNSKFVRDIYEKVVSMLADQDSMDNIQYYVIQKLNEVCSGLNHIDDFVITKAVGDINGFQIQRFTNEKGVEKAMIGNYTVPILSKDPVTRQDQLDRKDATNEKEYYLYCLPAQVQLAERMRERGSRVDTGTRLEYVITNPNKPNGKQYEKIESIDYVKKHGEYVKIDFLYYIKALMNPLDQVLDIAFQSEKKFGKGLIEQQYKLRNKTFRLVIDDIKKIRKPNFIFHTAKRKKPITVSNEPKLL
jgi:DNA polymerase elongation subunit (family B)